MHIYSLSFLENSETQPNESPREVTNNGNDAKSHCEAKSSGPTLRKWKHMYYVTVKAEGLKNRIDFYIDCSNTSEIDSIQAFKNTTHQIL